MTEIEKTMGAIKKLLRVLRTLGKLIEKREEHL